MNGETDPFATRFHEIRLPNRGLNTQLPDDSIADRELSVAWNVEVYPGGFRTTNGLMPIGNTGANWPLTGTLKYLDTVTFANGDRHLICITTSKAYRYDVTNDEWDDITPGSMGAGTDYNYTAAYMHTESGNEYWFFANGGKVLKYDGTNMTVLLGGDGYQTPTYHIALAVVVAWRRLWLLRVTEDGVDVVFRIRHSDVDAVDLSGDWIALGYVDVDETPDAIMGGAMLEQALVVYKDNSIHTVHATTNPDYPFRKASRVLGLGLCSPAALCNTPVGHFFVDFQASNVWLYNGMGLPLPKGDRVLENPTTLPAYENVENISVLSVLGDRRIYVAVPTYDLKTASVKVYNVYAYDWRLDAWTHMNIPGRVMGKYSASSARTWDDFVGLGAWDDWTGSWSDELGSRVKEQFIVGDGLGYVYLRTEDTPVNTYVGYSESGAGAVTGFVRPEPLPMGQLFEFREVHLRGSAEGGTLTAVTDMGQGVAQSLNFSGSARHTFSLYGRSLKLWFVREANAAERFDITRISVGYGVRGQRGADG